MKRDSFIKLPLSWLLFAVIWFPPTSANGQTYSVEQARKEGEVILLLDHHGRGFRSVEQGVKGKIPLYDCPSYTAWPRPTAGEDHAGTALRSIPGGCGLP